MLNNMEKLELKHLAPYLPYGLKVKFINASRFEDISILEPRDLNNNYTSDIKPILRPLSDLTKEIQVDGILHGIWIDSIELRITISQLLKKEIEIKNISVMIFYLLIENHFDVFGLIPEGLAIDINTLEI